MFAGVGFESVVVKIKGGVWRGLLLAAALLPGLIAIVQLHPYEYVYYNTLAGGVEGAYRKYELDYWMLSNLEAVEYLNETAPYNSRISFHSGDDMVPWFTREDIKIFDRPRTVPMEPKVRYLVVTTSNNIDLEYEQIFPEMAQVYAVERKGVPLMIVYEFPD